MSYPLCQLALWGMPGFKPKRASRIAIAYGLSKELCRSSMACVGCENHGAGIRYRLRWVLMRVNA